MIGRLGRRVPESGTRSLKTPKFLEAEGIETSSRVRFCFKVLGWRIMRVVSGTARPESSRKGSGA
jgi:hypothetical protein